MFRVFITHGSKEAYITLAKVYGRAVDVSGFPVVRDFRLKGNKRVVSASIPSESSLVLLVNDAWDRRPSRQKSLKKAFPRSVEYYQIFYPLGFPGAFQSQAENAQGVSITFAFDPHVKSIVIVEISKSYGSVQGVRRVQRRGESLHSQMEELPAPVAEFPVSGSSSMGSGLALRSRGCVEPSQDRRPPGVQKLLRVVVLACSVGMEIIPLFLICDSFVNGTILFSPQLLITMACGVIGFGMGVRWEKI